MCYLVVLLLHLFHHAIIFLFLSFRLFYFIKLLIFIRKCKSQKIAIFEILLKCHLFLTKLTELISNRPLQACLLLRLNFAFAFLRLCNAEASAVLFWLSEHCREWASERTLGSNLRRSPISEPKTPTPFRLRRPHHNQYFLSSAYLCLPFPVIDYRKNGSTAAVRTRTLTLVRAMSTAFTNTCRAFAPHTGRLYRNWE